ncbi:hypothetical protein [Clostridium sp. Cult2]|uniref:hypothetical protein n=1 Tax=Clostridium sp. Cult2 TaxID=2079003 RepID=UPI001F3D3DE9|nr:hypothetical protein [Clostridium sp. Cult2]MCF6464746.1 hypothetical protein [Clostridium sp. Cult2]
MIDIVSREEATYKVLLVAYKDIDQKTKNIITNNSVWNIKNKDIFIGQTNYQGSGVSFNLNDRVSIYIGWFQEQIMEKLDEGYTFEIVEIHKSYGDRRVNLLKNLAVENENNVIILNAQEV